MIEGSRVAMDEMEREETERMNDFLMRYVESSFFDIVNSQLTNYTS